MDHRHSSLREDSNRALSECMAHFQEGRTEEAIARLRLGISHLVRTPGEASVSSMSLGLALMMQGRTTEAFAQLRDAVRMYPHLAAPHVALSYALLFDGQVCDAFDEYREAIRIDTSDEPWSRARDLYLPLLHAFEQSGKASELFAVYTDVLFPGDQTLLNPATLLNPVEGFLERQPGEARKYACLHVLCELIQGTPISDITRRDWREIPDLITVWEFLSASPSDLDLCLDVYSSQLADYGFGGPTIRRRLQSAASFLKLCHELGYVKMGESDTHLPRWFTDAR